MIKLIYGDCLDKMPAIPSGSIDLILTDPPYGTTACKWDSIIPLNPMWEQLKRVIKPNGVIVMTASQPFTSVLITSNMNMFKYCWVWAKSKATGHLNAKKQPLRCSEDVCVFYNKQCTYIPQMVKGKRHHRGQKAQSKQTEVYGKFRFDLYYSDEYYPKNIQFLNVQERAIHPAQKPVALMEYLIKTYTNEGEVVLDFAMGSGTTGVACKNLNRSFIGIEKDKGYFDIAEGRIFGGDKGQQQVKREEPTHTAEAYRKEIIAATNEKIQRRR